MFGIQKFQKQFHNYLDSNIGDFGLYASYGAKMFSITYETVDQFGDIFDLYDLAHNGKPIIIEIGTSWPQACKDLSAWRSYVNEDAITKKWWKNKFLGIFSILY